MRWSLAFIASAAQERRCFISRRGRLAAIIRAAQQAHGGLRQLLPQPVSWQPQWLHLAVATGPAQDSSGVAVPTLLGEVAT